jgi:hypothetical protein
MLFSTLIRYYFRNKCEYIVSLRSSNSGGSGIFPRTHTAFVNAISSPIATFMQQEPTPMPEKVESPPNPGFTLIHPTPGGTLADNELTAHASASGNGLAEQQEDHMLSDARTFSSSPRAATVSMSPVSPVQSRSPHGVDLGVSTSITPSAYQPPLRNIRRMLFHALLLLTRPS